MGLSTPLATQCHRWVEGDANNPRGKRAQKGDGTGYLIWREAYTIGGSMGSFALNPDSAGAVGPYDPSNGIISPGDIAFIYP